MVDGKTISSVTVCSLSNSNYFSNEDHQITGGSERQIKYLVDALLSNEIKVQVLLTNSTNHVSNVNENLCIKNLWGAKSNFLYKIFKLSLSLMASNQYIYLRGLSWAHLYIIFISRLLGRKIILSMTPKYDLILRQDGEIKTKQIMAIDINDAIAKGKLENSDLKGVVFSDQNKESSM